MKKYLFFSILFSLFCANTVFSQTVNELRETARSFLQQSDFSNAILVLNRAQQMEPKNIDIIKDLSLAYYFQKDNARALEIIKPILDGEDADDQCYQIAGNIYKQLEQPKESEKLFRRGSKKFPASGAMLNELGEILWMQKDYNAIKQWEKGIEVDPAYSKNYFNASKFYYLSTDKVWSILYGEIFINMEPNSSKSGEIKGIILEGYKKLFVEMDLTKPEEGSSEFQKAFLKIMSKQSNIASGGINAESLTMIRTRFILDWFSVQKDQMPFRLFEQQRQFLQEGMFDAYNQWIFGPVQNLTSYQNWVANNKSAHQDFTKFQQGRVFKIPTGQYYHR